MREFGERDLVLSKALSAAADKLQQHVDKLRRDARSALTAAENSRALWHKISTAPHLVDMLRANGSNDPINEAAALLDALPSFVEAHYDNFKQHMGERTKRQRDRLIVLLAREKTNREIADRFGLSTRQVQRILKAADMGRYTRD